MTIMLGYISQTPVEIYENKSGIVRLLVLRSTPLMPQEVPPKKTKHMM